MYKMSKSINIVPIKMNKINRVNASVKPQNVKKEKVEKEEIDYSQQVENNNDFKSSLLYMIINTYLTNKLIEGTKTLKELAENTNKDEFMTIGKFLKKYNTTKTLIEDYKKTEKDIKATQTHRPVKHIVSDVLGPLKAKGPEETAE